MSHENKDILFEGRDTHNRQILIFGIWLFVIMAGCAVLMIPLTHYLWDLVKDSTATPSAQAIAPDIILEAHPSQELVKMLDENKADDAENKINQAMKDMLTQGFPVKS